MHRIYVAYIISFLLGSAGTSALSLRNRLYQPGKDIGEERSFPNQRPVSKQSKAYRLFVKDNTERKDVEFDLDLDTTQQIRIITPALLRRLLRQGDILHHENAQKLDQFEQNNKLTCAACEAASLVVQGLIQKHLGESIVKLVVSKVCTLVKIESERVCQLVVKTFHNEIFYIMRNLKPKELCYWLLGDSCPKPAGYLPDWNITLPNTPKPPLRHRRSPAPGSPVSKVLFLTDTHMDVRYKAGASAECGEPLCCRDNDVQPVNKSQAAGKWGDYRNCDMPPWTFEGMLKNLSQFDFEFILFTGDIPAHDVWNQSMADQVDKNNRFTQLMLKYFPETPVYAALGNHAPSPVNSYPPPQLANEPGGNISWLYFAVTHNWQHWLMPDAFKTVMKGGFYTDIIRPGLRVVSLNNNYCSTDDWWLLVGENSVDPVGQLSWFASVMQEAENKNEMVLILSHRPTDGCMESWSRNYYKIINRYENIIVSQFFGHAHTDELRLYYDNTNTSRVNSIAFIGPGYTTYSYLNAGYRIYTFDGNYNDSTHAILDGQTYYLNITDANRSDNPVWKLEYSFKKDYQMKSLFPEDWGDLVNRFQSNDTLLQKYHQHISKNEDLAYCDSECKHSTICNIKHSTNGMQTHC